MLLINKPFMLLILSSMCIFGIAALGVNLVSGYAGQISIGHASFMLIGAYTSSLMSIKLGSPFIVNAAVGMVIAAILGLVIGLPALRLKGFYLAIATMAFGIAVEQFVSAVDFFGGPLGVKNIPAFFESEFTVYLWNLGFFLTISYLVSIVINSPMGIRYKMVRDSEMAASAYGIRPSSVKLNSFMVSAAICSVAGSLYAHTIGYINPMDFGLFQSVYLLAAVIIGGMATITGGFLGVVIIYGMPFLFSRSQFPMTLIIGPILIIFVLFVPRGIDYGIRSLYGKYLQRPYIWIIRLFLRAKGPEGKFAEVQGKKIHYVETGEGPPVILIHGNLACFKWFYRVRDLPGFKTYAVDLVNHGRSEWTPEVSIDLYAEYIKGFMDSMGIERATVVGHSLGGTVGMALALKYPDRVERLLLLASGPPGGIRVAEEMYPVYERLKTDRNLLMQFMESVAPTFKDKWGLSRLADYSYLQNPLVFTENPRAVERGDLTRTPSKYNGPVLFIRGKRDIAISREMAVKTVKFFGGKARLKEFDYFGHSLVLEDPECFKREFLEFVERG